MATLRHENTLTISAARDYVFCEREQPILKPPALRVVDYEAFDAAEARRLIERLEVVYTPKHGSWLNIAEIELNALSGQCLSRRIDKKEFLRSEVAAWEADRNASQTGLDWRFTTSDARIKLKRLYPQIQN